VAVRGGEEQLEKENSSILIEAKEAEKKKKLLNLLGHLFHWEEIEIGSTADYRSEMVITLGRDALGLF